MKKIAVILVLISILCAAIPVGAANSTTFTYTLNNKGQPVRTQDAYLPDKTITDLKLSVPEDLFVDYENNLYIADTGNRRILKYDIAQATVVMELAFEGFKSPRGVYVTASGDIYVADSGAETVFRFDKDGILIEQFDRPTSASYSDAAYAPYRVAVDNRGNLYIVGEGIYSGIIHLSGNGDFLGYFTTNKTRLTFLQMLQNLFFTDVQKANLQDRLPMTFSSVYADPKGLVYTATIGTHQDGVKKHNTAGANMFEENWSPESVTDVTTDEQGIIYASDKDGLIAMYSPDGNFIFAFGSERSEVDIAGLYSSLMAIAIDQNGSIWTLDNDKAFLQSYSPTEFTLTTYQAIDLFSKGKYSQAREMWTEVLRLNQMSVLAHTGIGKAYLYEQKYAESMVHFEVAGNRQFYSQAFWEIRNTWLQDNLSLVLTVVIVLFVLSLANKYLDRKKRLKALTASVKSKILGVHFVRDINCALTATTHPIDTFYDVKRKKRGSVLAAIVLYLIFFAAFMTYQVGKAYIFQFVAVEDLDLNAIVWGFWGITGLFVLCNYLVSSINQGEGTFADVFKALAYSTIPLTVALFGITALTYVVTYNEVFMLGFALQMCGLWSVVVLFLGLQEMHNYDIRNTIKSLVITFLFMILATVVLLMLFVMFDQFKQFFESIIKELIANVTGQI